VTFDVPSISIHAYDSNEKVNFVRRRKAKEKNRDRVVCKRVQLCSVSTETMSTRWYPIYQKGNPQLRVFLPNFWMKMIRPENTQPDNVVAFKVSMEMTKFDVINYLRDIYKVPVVDVRTRIATGETYTDKYKKYVKKKDDNKIAYVTLPKDVKFEFPDLFPVAAKKEEGDKMNKAVDEMQVQFKKYVERNKNRPGLPGWYSI